jgi:hypothetical protein
MGEIAFGRMGAEKFINVPIETLITSIIYIEYIQR